MLRFTLTILVLFLAVASADAEEKGSTSFNEYKNSIAEMVARVVKSIYLEDDQNSTKVKVSSATIETIRSNQHVVVSRHPVIKTLNKARYKVDPNPGKKNEIHYVTCKTKIFSELKNLYPDPMPTTTCFNDETGEKVELKFDGGNRMHNYYLSGSFYPESPENSILILSDNINNTVLQADFSSSQNVQIITEVKEMFSEPRKKSKSTFEKVRGRR